MFIKQYSASNLRGLKFFTLTPGKQINVLIGKNNDGKTTVLEGIYYCSCLKSFKSVSLDSLLMEDQKKLQISLISSKIGEKYTISTEKSLNSANISKINDKKVSVRTLMITTPVIALTFGTENTVTQSSEYRRGLLDWGAFHVEPSYLDVYKLFVKTLKQRNTLLKSTNKESLDFWTEKLAEVGTRLEELRSNYFDLLFSEYLRYIDLIKSYDATTYSDIQNSTIAYKKGWDDSISLSEALAAAHTKDTALKYSSAGPHRSDILFLNQTRDIKSISSMSTQIIISLLFVLSQAEVFHVKHGFRPIILIDDLFFGIDDKNLKLVINLLIDSKSQCFISAPDLYKEKIKSLDRDDKEIRLYSFHNGVLKEEDK